MYKIYIALIVNILCPHMNSISVAKRLIRLDLPHRSFTIDLTWIHQTLVCYFLIVWNTNSLLLYSDITIYRYVAMVLHSRDKSFRNYGYDVNT